MLNEYFNNYTLITMKPCKSIIALAFVVLLLGTAKTHADQATIKTMLANSMPLMPIDSIQLSPVKGWYEVVTDSTVLYVSGDGKFLLQGYLIDLENEINLTDTKQASLRQHALNKIGDDQLLSFKPATSKYKAFVFTDIDCGYCRKLHAEIEHYLAAGITIQYLFYPRAGKASESYDKAVSVWCSDDRHSALTAAKKGEPLTAKSCPNPVDKHMQLAATFGIKGTPMIVTEQGTVYPGYISVERLLKILVAEQ